ncbi:MAG: D-glycerate 2-kinase, partial [uncultured Rubellimicrobium sp.]
RPGPDLGWRIRAPCGAGAGGDAGRQAGGECGPSRVRGADLGDEHGPQAPEPREGRPVGRNGLPGPDAFAPHLGRAGRRPRRDRIGPHGRGGIDARRSLGPARPLAHRCPGLGPRGAVPAHRGRAAGGPGPRPRHGSGRRGPRAVAGRCRGNGPGGELRGEDARRRHRGRGARRGPPDGGRGPRGPARPRARCAAAAPVGWRADRHPARRRQRGAQRRVRAGPGHRPGRRARYSCLGLRHRRGGRGGRGGGRGDRPRHAGARARLGGRCPGRSRPQRRPRVLRALGRPGRHRSHVDQRQRFSCGADCQV